MENQPEHTGILNGWVFDKRISFSELLTVFSILIFGIVWGLRLESRVYINERSIQKVEQRADEDRKRLVRIEDKTDRIYEKISEIK